MKRVFYVVVIFCFMISCSPRPEPIDFGQDACHFCKMTLMDNKFGAELVTRKGKVYKFDDVICLGRYYTSGEPSEEFLHKLVVDFANPGTLIDATNAFYITSPEIRSPMDGQVAAFASKTDMESMNAKLKGTQLSWNEVADRFR